MTFVHLLHIQEIGLSHSHSFTATAVVTGVMVGQHLILVYQEVCMATCLHPPFAPPVTTQLSLAPLLLPH